MTLAAAPPPVHHACGRTPLLGRGLLLLWLAGLTLGSTTVLLGDLSSARLLMMGMAVACSGLALLLFWASQESRHLIWDGTEWLLGAPTSPRGSTLRRITPPEVRLDLQDMLLLRYRPLGGSGARWLWLQAGPNRESWHLLRCALHHGAAGAAGAALADGRA